MLEQKYKHMALMCQKNIVPTDKTLRSCMLDWPLHSLLFTASMMYQYFVKIVPTIYVKGDGEVRELS